MPCFDASGVVDSHVALLTDLNRQFDPLASNQLGPLDGDDPRFDAEFTERCFQFLDECLFDLGLWVHDAADQAFAEATDPLTDDIAGVGDFDDQHTNCGVAKKPYPQ